MLHMENSRVVLQLVFWALSGPLCVCLTFNNKPALDVMLYTCIREFIVSNFEEHWLLSLVVFVVFV
jgi:hypothetical protein